MRKSGLKTRLARARVTAGLTQVEFSKIAGTSIDQIRHFERGGRPMTSFILARFAQILGVSGAWLSGVGKEDEPVALDGEPYTCEKYLEYKARGIQYTWDWDGDKMDSETRVLLTHRAEAWRLYLNSLITGVFTGKVDWFSPLNHEDIGLKILSILREYIGDQRLPEWTVDTVIRHVRKEQENSVTKA